MKLSFDIRHKIAMWLIPVYASCFVGSIIISNIILLFVGVGVFCVDFIFGLSQLDRSVSDNTEQTEESK